MLLPQVPLLNEAANITASAVVLEPCAAQPSLFSSFLMSFFSVLSYLSTLLLALFCSAPGTASTSINLPSYPLAVKHPYLSAWVPGAQLGRKTSPRPQFWNGQNLTWPILARVDGATYALFGVPEPVPGIQNAAFDSVSYTSSHTTLALHAGQTNFTLDFFSPILPAAEDYARQSLPYSYLTVSASSADGGEADVQVLSGIDQTWTNQNGAAKLNYSETGTARFFTFHNPDEILFTETNEAMATYGTVVWGALSGEGTSHGSGSVVGVLGEFAKSGSLAAPRDETEHDFAALTKDLGKVGGGGAKSVTFAVGFDRADAINYLGQTQTGYYRSKWPTIPEAVEYFLQSYDDANAASKTVDKEVRQRAEAVSTAFGSKYADIIEASVRQTFGALELTVSERMELLEVLLTTGSGPQKQSLR